ncbi:tRNA (N6-isopentenyl adenosine(37)-C2)-methylthiotransferase MiaB [Candidatus Omnitrophota bacterium]
MSSKRLYIRTFGCQMNDRDSEFVIGQFLSNSYKLATDVLEADVILLNTCSVRQHAEDKVFSELGRLRKLKNSNSRQTTIGVIGCMAKNLGNRIIKRMPHVDIVCSPNDLDKIYRLVENARKQKRHLVEIGSQIRDSSFYKHFYHQDKTHSYVNISEGCSNFCSYCVVPYVRGKHRSRPVVDILNEINQLIKDGVNSITLLGQNVNDYSQVAGKKKTEFVNLLDIISDIEDIKELNFVTSHPKDVDIKLFDLMASKRNIKKYLHLPVQSGSNRILKLMNRKYTREKYVEIIEQYRKEIPNGNLATDIIVGFPMESDKDFRDTLNLVKKIKFNHAFIFKYSPRPHTKASNMIDDVPMDVKKKRHKILLDLQKKISKAKKR